MGVYILELLRATKSKTVNVYSLVLINRAMSPRRRTSFEECLGVNMSPAQREVFVIVDEWWKRFHSSPSLRDIMDMRGKGGIGNTARLVDRLVELGVLKRLKNRGRTIRPVYINFRKVE